MIEHSIGDGYVIFKVQVVPRASHSEIVGEHNGALRVRLAAAPVDGEANDELMRVLAKHLKVPRSAVEIKAGHRSKSKQVQVSSGREKVLEMLRDHE